MRKLTENGRKVVLELPCQVRGRVLVATATVHGLELREKGCRTVYLVPWQVAYWVGAKLAAESRQEFSYKYMKNASAAASDDGGISLSRGGTGRRKCNEKTPQRHRGTEERK